MKSSTIFWNIFWLPLILPPMLVIGALYGMVKAVDLAMFNVANRKIGDYEIFKPKS